MNEATVSNKRLVSKAVVYFLQLASITQMYKTYIKHYILHNYYFPLTINFTTGFSDFSILYIARASEHVQSVQIIKIK